MTMTNDNNFTKAMQFVARWEWGNKPDGGYTNDPVDPGGETKWGISKRYHQTLDIKNLAIDKAFEIYFSEYWLPSRCDRELLPEAVVIMDTAVNCGVKRARAFSQNAGSFHDIIAKRIEYYANLVTEKPKLTKFYKGWINRCVDLRKYAEILEKETN